jgi:1-deoxy-D-xylulose-5-phosphate reductoisomerase
MTPSQAASSEASLPDQKPRRISILGATGSIGCSTLDLVMCNRERFTVEALTAASNVERLARQAVECGAKLAVISDAARYDDLKSALAGTGIETAAGADALIEAASRPVDLVMAAIVGAAGLAPTLAAVRHSSALALANKECLVCAGDLFVAEVKRHNTVLLPVDSEHNAVFQVLAPEHDDQIARLILTASGGPFRTWDLDAMARAKPEDALKHPNWSMGPKLTVDSATMVNKGLELIEAYHLFPVSVEQLDVLVHPQSIVHSLVEYHDGSVLAQMGTPDMRIPISYALSWPGRMATPSPRLDLKTQGALTFEAIDENRFPAVRLALDCLKRHDGAPTVFNAANEVAVERFLEGEIGFLDICRLSEWALREIDKLGLLHAPGSLAQVYELDRETRKLCQTF